MAVRIVEKDAENLFLKALENYNQKKESRSILHCRFSVTGNSAKSEILFSAIEPAINNCDGELFFFRDGDVVISWHGNQPEVISFVKSAVQLQFRFIATAVAEQKFYQEYDSITNADTLKADFGQRFETFKKQESEKVNSVATDLQNVSVPVESAEKIAFNEIQIKSLQTEIKERKLRRGLEYAGLNILIVEDQDFSRRILQSMLPKSYNNHSARNAKEALELYSKTAHEIVFLDIELPDMNGHEIAKLIKQHDPESFIVMVTANNYEADVEAACKNQVQGFIAKPYNKKKIMDAIDAYLRRQNKKPQKVGTN